MSVIDYTYVDKVAVDSNDNPAVEGGGMMGHGGQDQDSVHNLKLLIKDERLDEDANWVNAKLAGQLWVESVLDFYIDHLVIEQPDDTSDTEDVENPLDTINGDDWLIKLVQGIQLLADEQDLVVTAVKKTYNVSVHEWRKEMSMILEEEDVKDLGSALNEVSISNDVVSDLRDATVSYGINPNNDVKGDPSHNNGEDEEDSNVVLLFEVELAKYNATQGNLVDKQKVLMHLEDLREKAPQQLLEFLQSKLKFTNDE